MKYKYKCVSVIGARPQFIKAAPITRIMDRFGIKEVLVHTGQHYDHNMSHVFFRELKIREPDYNLGIGSLSHGAQTGRMMERIESVLMKEKPGIVMVYGDTNSTIAAALAAVKLHIPVAHIEAGLRSYNKKMPEEANRVLTDHVSDILFCPTRTAVKNLRKEGFTNIINNGRLIEDSFAESRSLDSPAVVNVGDVMYDSVLFNLSIAKKSSKVLQTYKLSQKNYCLATIHRAENTDDRTKLESIFRSFNEIAQKVPVIIPLHPRTKKLVKDPDRFDKNLTIVPPVSYMDMLMLSSSARLILTDSGGLQKEAFFLNVPCVTLRDETEWIETLRSGMNTLAGTSESKILRAVRHQERVSLKEREKLNFGDGNASERVLNIMKIFLK